MLVRELMTSNVESVTPDTSIREAAQKMASLNVGAMPIAENGEPQGIITDRDICIRGVAQNADPTTTTVSDLMTDETVTIFADQDAEEAGRTMKDKKIRRVLVVDGSGKLCGIVAVGDLLTEDAAQDIGDDVVETVSEPASPNR